MIELRFYQYYSSKKISDTYVNLLVKHDLSFEILFSNVNSIF